jgi:hypothetical protein
MAENTEYTNQTDGSSDNQFGIAPVSTTSETGSAAATWKDQAVEMKDQALDTGQKVLAQTMAQTKASAGQAIDRAKDQVKSQITSQKDRTVDGLSGAVRALESTGQQFRNEDLALVANYADSLTGQVRRASDYLSERSVDDIARDVEGFARKNPSLFIGGAFVLGIALARFLRSSESPSPWAAFSADRTTLAPVTPLSLPASDSPSDAFGERPLTAHNYVPGVGVTATGDSA